MDSCYIYCMPYCQIHEYRLVAQKYSSLEVLDIKEYLAVFGRDMNHLAKAFSLGVMLLTFCDLKDVIDSKEFAVQNQTFKMAAILTSTFGHRPYL